MSDWLSNRKARARVVALLAKAGVPLELEVAKVVSEVVEEMSGTTGIFPSSETVVYEPPDSPGTYRELDRLFQLYQEVVLDDRTGLQLLVSAPIECKSREDVELFLFPTDRTRALKRFPLFGDFIGSRLGSRLRGTLAALRQENVGSLVALKIKNGSTPGSVEKEELVYKAGGAVYDFAYSDMQGFNGDGREVQVIRDLDLLTQFDAFRNEHQWTWEFALPRFVTGLSHEVREQFREAYFGTGRLFHSLHAHVPIVCVDSPLYEVKWEPTGHDVEFREIPSAASIIRKQGWPGECRGGLLEKGPELPVLITNPKHLPQVLRRLDQWRQAIVTALQGASKGEMRDWPIEAALYRAAMRIYGDVHSWHYRSDLD